MQRHKQLKSSVLIVVSSVVLCFSLSNQVIHAQELVSNETESTIVSSNNNETEIAVSNYNGTVTFVGQWISDSSKKIDTTVNFTTIDDKLGKPRFNTGLLRSLTKTFLGWADKAPEGNGKLAQGARLFSPEDTIGTALPNGIMEDSKLYAVYYSLNEPNTPFPSGNSEAITALEGTSDILTGLNNNAVIINPTIKSEEVLPNTILKQNIQYAGNNTDIILDKYDDTIDDVNKVNEVVLNAEFKMNDTLSMLAYKNPIGSSLLSPLLSRDYTTRYRTGEFNTEDGNAAGYTYVDLNILLDSGITIPEKLYLEFSSYSWRPLYALDENKNILPIFNPETEEVLGQDKNSFDILVNNRSPKITFGVNTPNAKQITIRAILRHGNNEKIKEMNIVPTISGKSVAEEILTNMSLRALTSSEIKQINTTLSDQNVNSRVIRIGNVRAQKSALVNTLSNIVDTLNITGSLNGHLFVNVGSVPTSPFLELGGNVALSNDTANTIVLGYLTHFKVTHQFISSDVTRILPKEIIDSTPSEQTNIDNGAIIIPPTIDTTEVQEHDGVWRFVGWDKESVQINGADVQLVGRWAFEKVLNKQEEIIQKIGTKDSMTTPQFDKRELVKKQKLDNSEITINKKSALNIEKSTKKKELPQTGTTDVIWIAMLSLISSMVVALGVIKEK